MGGMESNRRSLLMAAPLLLAAIAAGDKAGSSGDVKLAPAPKTGPDPRETFVQQYDQIGFQPWGNLPPHSGEMAKLYGDFDKPGPYLVMMKWNPGWFSAPHTYATDRIQVVVFGTWFVNSGNEFQPQDALPVGPGGYVKRTARTPHYDGVPANQPDPAVIAVFGVGRLTHSCRPRATVVPASVRMAFVRRIAADEQTSGFRVGRRGTAATPRTDAGLMLLIAA